MQNTRRQDLSEEALKQKLVKTVLITIALLGVMSLSFVFFGTKIGALFGFISKYRNDQIPQATVTLSPPIFTNPTKATKEEKITLEGIALPGNTIVLFVNGPEKAKTTTAEDGTFTFTDITLSKGKNTIFAKAIDTKGSESNKSETLSIVRDEDKPKVEIFEPKNGETIKNLNERIIVSGKVNEKATIKVNNTHVPQKSDLTFTYLLGVKEGDVKIIVVVTDEAGNEQKEVLDIKYEKGS